METKPPSFIHKCRETARARAGLCALRLFSFQDWASSPAGHEMSRRDAIVGHSASREWTERFNLAFHLLFWHRIRGPFRGLTVKGQKAAIWMLAEMGCSPIPAGQGSLPDTKAGPWGCTSGGGGGLPLLSLVCSGPRRESFGFHGYAVLCLGGRGMGGCFQFQKPLGVVSFSVFWCGGRHRGRSARAARFPRLRRFH